MIARSRLPALAALLLALPFAASARDFTYADLEGRVAFRSTVDQANRHAPLGESYETYWSRDGHNQGEVEFRGALTFDGVGGVHGFRLVWATMHESPMDGSATPDYVDHRLVPLRQEIVGSYTVSEDGVVAMTYELTPTRLFYVYRPHGGPGVVSASSTETAQAILTGNRGLDGFFVQHLRQEWADDDQPTPHVRVGTFLMRFESLGGCGGDESATPRFDLGSRDLRPGH